MNICDFVPLESKRGARGREGGAANEADVLRIAVHLADRLADWKSLAFFRKVARVVPENVIQWGLRCALDLKTSEVTRSRGAYFTSLMQPHLPARRRDHAPSNSA